MKPVKQMGILPPAMLCLLSGCAGSAPAHVTRAADARPSRETRIDERVTAVEARMNEMNQRVDKVGGQVQGLERGVAGAQSRAEAAAAQAAGVDQRLTRLWSNRFNQQTADSLEVYFSPDSINLSDAAQTALAGVVKELQANPTVTVELGGYTDPHGALDYNYALSQRRVDAVRRFLIDKGIQLARIQAASLGPLGGTDIPDTKKRRVTVRLMVDRE